MEFIRNKLERNMYPLPDYDKIKSDLHMDINDPVKKLYSGDFGGLTTGAPELPSKPETNVVDDSGKVIEPEYVITSDTIETEEK